MAKDKHFQRVWPLYAIFGSALITLLCARAFIGEAKFDWPTWIQAVGSVAAILVAVWVPYLQGNDAAAAELAKEREEARRICLAIRDELRMVAKAFAEGPNVQTLLKLAVGDIFNIAVPNIDAAERFPIYRSVVGRLTLINDDELRHDIIWSYELAIALMHMGIQNNRMLFELRDLNRDTAGKEFEFQYQCLQESAMSMQKTCKQTIDRVTRLLARLDQITARA